MVHGAEGAAMPMLPTVHEVQASSAEPVAPNWKVYQTPLRIPVACAPGAIPPISANPSAIEPSRFFSLITSPCMIAGEPGPPVLKQSARQRSSRAISGTYDCNEYATVINPDVRQGLRVTRLG